MAIARELVWNHRNEIGKGMACAGTVAAGAVKGVADMVHDFVSLATHNKGRIEKLERKLKLQADEYRDLLKNHRELVTDMLAIGGVEIAAVLHGEAIPDEIIRAYETAYPGLASEMSLREALDGKSLEQVTGMAAAIKGKLFEMKYVDYLNDGHLPEGFSANLAESVTQPGYDILVSGPDGALAEAFQLKATDSVQYIQEALTRHPDITVITTDEVFEKLMLHNSLLGEDVIKSGMSDAGLEELVAKALDSDSGLEDIFETPLPIISLALIAFSEYRVQDKNFYQKGFSFGERGVGAWVAIYAGSLLAGITGTWWIAILGSLGTRYLFNKGKTQRQLVKKLKKMLKDNEQMIGCMQRKKGAGHALLSRPGKNEPQSLDRGVPNCTANWH